MLAVTRTRTQQRRITLSTQSRKLSERLHTCKVFLHRIQQACHGMLVGTYLIVSAHPADRSCPAWVYSDPDTWVAPPDPCEPKLVHQLVVATNSLTQANIPGTGKKHTWGTCAAAEAEAGSSQVRQSTNSDI